MQGHLQPRYHSKAWSLGRQLSNGPLVIQTYHCLKRV